LSKADWCGTKRDRPDYRERTIDEAIAQTTETFDPTRNGGYSQAGRPTPQQSRTTSIEDAEREAIQAEGASGKLVEHKPDETFTVPSHWRWLDVARLRDWNCLPLRWNIQDLIAQGNFVIVAAETQTGKTLFGVFLGQSMLHAGRLFGKLEINPVEKVLYLGLEDPDRRFKERLQDIESQFPKIEDGVSSSTSHRDSLSGIQRRWDTLSNSSRVTASRSCFSIPTKKQRLGSVHSATNNRARFYTVFAM
jgi:hypothetical protein